MMDVEIKSSKKKKRSVRDPKDRWSNLMKKNVIKFSKKVKEEGNSRKIEEADRMWEEMTECT